MRKPFKAGRWTLEITEDKRWWLMGCVSQNLWLDATDADLRAINRLTARALKGRAKRKP